MGLDVTAYGKVERMGDLPQSQEDELDVDGITLVRNHHFLDRCPDLQDGVYKVLDEGSTLDFRAGSYSGYSYFRNSLCKAVLNVPDWAIWDNRRQYNKSPFYELVDFSDCEGVIGPRVSAKLYQDFVDNRAKFIEYTEKESSYSGQALVTTYDLFMAAFKLASEGGFVSFH